MLRDVNRAVPKIAEHHRERFSWDYIHDVQVYEGQVLLRGFGEFCKKHRPPTGVATLTRACVIEVKVTPLKRRIFRDGVRIGYGTWFRAG